MENKTENLLEKKNYVISSEYLEKLKEKIKKHNKKGSLLKLNILEKDFINDKFVVNVENEIIRINGWEVVAKIEKTSTGNIVFPLSDTNIPLKYWTTPIECDHCKQNRIRKYGVLLYNNENNLFKMVGFSCLGDFIGSDISSYLERIKILTTLNEEIEEMESIYIRLTQKNSLDLFNYLLCVVDEINEVGWVKADCLEEGTANKALYRYRDISSKKNVLFLDLFNATLKSEAEKTILFFRSLKIEDFEESFVKNMITIFSSDSFISKNKGIVAYAPILMKNIINQKAKKESEKIHKDEFFGEIGSKTTSTLLLTKKIYLIESRFPVYLLLFQDSEGRMISSFTNGKIVNEMKEAEKYNCSFLIKEHSVYNGKKQTVIKNIKIVK